MHGEQPQSAVRRAYDIVADTYADHFRSTDPEQPEDLTAITEFVSLLPKRPQVLDAGCGAGRMLPHLSALGCDVEGVDLSPHMIRRAQSDHASFASQVASLSSLPFEDGRFDGAFYWYSTIHSPDQDLPQILAEAKRVTRRGGFVLLAFQTGGGTRDVSENYRRRGHEIQLLRYVRTADVMRSQLRTADLDEAWSLDRPAVGNERDGQAVLIARA